MSDVSVSDLVLINRIRAVLDLAPVEQADDGNSALNVLITSLVAETRRADMYRNTADTMSEWADDATRRAEKAENALTFYADYRNYSRQPVPDAERGQYPTYTPVLLDEGGRARSALAAGGAPECRCVYPDKCFCNQLAAGAPEQETEKHPCQRCGFDKWEYVDYGGCSVCRSYEDRAAEDAGAPGQAEPIQPIAKRGGYQPSAAGPSPTKPPPQRSDSRRSASPPEQATDE